MDSSEKTYEERLIAWQKARFSPPPTKPQDPIDPTFVEKVPMRDEIRLYTEVFLPSLSNSFPVVFIRSPYPFGRLSRNGKISVNRYFMEGYAVVFQLTRGQGKSEGQFRFLQDDIDDGYDAIEWIARQYWCNGHIGMVGASYLGSTQLLAAKAKPPALKCIMPTAFVGDPTQCFPFSYGVLNKSFYMQWHQLLDVEKWEDMDVDYCDINALNHPKWGSAFRKRPIIDAANDVLDGDKLVNWKETVANSMDNAFWRRIKFSDGDLKELDIPIFFTDGWYDMTIGPIDFFTRLDRIQSERPDCYLLVGPWDHYQTGSICEPRENNGDRILPEDGAWNPIDLRIAFFDRYLKGNKETIVQKDRVRVYITSSLDNGDNSNGRIGGWLNLPTFPAPNTNYKYFYLHSQGGADRFPGDGLLSRDTPTDEPADHYIYDPSLPTPFQMETFRDRRDVEIRADVLTYTSKPLLTPITILGEITLILYASSDAFDTDWFAVVTEVYPCGQSKSFHYAPPAFRARYRQGLDKEVLLVPGKPEEFRIPLGPAGHRISKGHCLRLSIFSAAFPEYEPNTNTGNQAATDVDRCIAKQTIYHNIDMPSCLILPIFEG